MPTNEEKQSSFADKLESSLDFTNWRDHPTNGEYRVYFFYKEEQAEFFANMLKDRNWEFERDTEPLEEGKTRYYFAIHKRYWDQIKDLNNIAIGKYRKRFIPDKIFMWIILVVGFGVLALAILGAIVSD